MFLSAFTVGVAVRSGRVKLAKQPSKKKHHKTPKEPPRTPQDPSRTPQVPSISSPGPLKSRKSKENNPPTQSCVSEPVGGKVYLPPLPPLPLDTIPAETRKSTKHSRFYNVCEPRPSFSSSPKGGGGPSGVLSHLVEKTQRFR